MARKPAPFEAGYSGWRTHARVGDTTDKSPIVLSSDGNYYDHTLSAREARAFAYWLTLAADHVESLNTPNEAGSL